MTTIGQLSDRATRLVIPSIKALQDLRYAGQRLATDIRDHRRISPLPLNLREEAVSDALSRFVSLERKMPSPSPELLSRLELATRQLLDRCGTAHHLKDAPPSPLESVATERCIEAEQTFLSLLEGEIMRKRKYLERIHREMDDSISRATKTILAGSSIALLIALVSAYLISRSIATPLRSIREGAERLQRGEYSFRLTRYGLDEFGDLAVTFNAMAASLEKALTESIESKRYLENIIATMGEAVIVTDDSRKILLANDAAMILLADGSLPGDRFDPLLGDSSRLEELLTGITETGRVDFHETTLRRVSGESVPVELAAALITLPRGGRGIVWIAHDIRERKGHEERIRHLAFFDPLTGLPNRALFQDRFTQAIHISTRQKRQIAILLIDLDRFKEINETMGHSVGDELLKQVAGRLEVTVRRSDTLARLGGDEFVVMATGAAEAEGVSILAQKLLDRIAEPLDLSGREIMTTASIGISLFPDDGEDVDTLLSQADMALYAAKEKGRNRFCFYSAGMNESLRERREIETRLKGAISRGELYLDYQPQYELSTNRLVAVEALVRWRDPDRGVISPDRFIAVAEQSGLIHELGEWVLTEACLQGCLWSDAGLPPIRIAVNISGKQFARDDFIEVIDRVLERTGLNPSRLELELTESILMENTRHAIDSLVDFKVRGIHLAIDDFGTGYSSLSYLKFIPLDRLKIDRTFVRDIIDDPDDASIVAAIIGLSHSLGLKVIAEGVESAEQMAFLQEHGCDEVQGYFTGKPIPPDVIASLLRQPSRESTP
ncbi:MAG: EAL domain-containing protein [Desulfuromonadia bacterium]